MPVKFVVPPTERLFVVVMRPVADMLLLHDIAPVAKAFVAIPPGLRLFMMLPWKIDVPDTVKSLDTVRPLFAVIGPALITLPKPVVCRLPSVEIPLPVLKPVVMLPFTVRLFPNVIVPSELKVDCGVLMLPLLGHIVISPPPHFKRFACTVGTVRVPVNAGLVVGIDAPVGPMAPVLPCMPCMPASPCEPVGPVEPCMPASPCEPVGPVAPCMPCMPCEPVGPVEP